MILSRVGLQLKRKHKTFVLEFQYIFHNACKHASELHRVRMSENVLFWPGELRTRSAERDKKHLGSGAWSSSSPHPLRCTQTLHKCSLSLTGEVTWNTHIHTHTLSWYSVYTLNNPSYIVSKSRINILFNEVDKNTQK